MTTGIGGLGGVLVGLPGILMESLDAAPWIDPCRRLPDVANRYGVRRALSGTLCGSVGMISGAVICLPERETDFALRGRLPIEWSRFYSSTLHVSGMLGAGWRTGWEVTLRREGETLTYFDEHGRALTVPFPARGSQVIISSEQLHVAHLPDGRLVVADLTPRYRVFGDFDAHGVARLKYIEDLHQQRIGCIWDAEGRLLRMRGTCGHELRMHYDPATGSRLVAIECVDGGPTGILVQYGFNEDGQLAEVRNRLGDTVRRFAYRDGRIIEETGPLGRVTRYAWQTFGGTARVVERATCDGARERCLYRLETRTSEVTDVFGYTAYWQYDERGRVVSHWDFDGRCYKFQYHGTGSPSTLWLPGERVVRLDYDQLGRVAKETDPLGQSRSTLYAFATCEPLVITLNDRRTWIWRRNDRVQPVQCQSPSGEITRIEYGGDGLPARCADVQGRVTTLEHNAWGQVTRRISAEGDATQYDYDINGHLAAITDVLGAVTHFERDGLGRPLTVTRADGRHERHVWNAAGQRISFVGASGQSRHWHRDRRGHVVRAIDEEGHVIAYGYDAHGRRIRVESGNGATQTLEWDAAGRLRTITDADGVSRTFAYTNAGQVQKITTKAGTHERHETFSYDVMGHLICRDTSHNRYVYTYSARGLLEEVNRTPTKEGVTLGIVADAIRFEYDARGRLLAEQGTNGELRYGYDPSGRLISTRLPHGQLLKMPRYATGAMAYAELGEHRITQFWYDPMQREILRTQGVLFTQTDYTALGWPSSWRSVSSNGTSGPATPSASDMQLWREVHYHASGTVVQVDDGARGATYYDYDRRGRLLRCVSDRLGIEYFTWDAAGNLLDTPGGNWLPAIYSNHRLRESRGYRYAYDVWGQVVEKKGRDYTLLLKWDAEGHLIAARRKGRTVRYQYDALGRRISKSVESASTRHSLAQVQAETTRFLWQGDRLVQESGDGRVRTYLYQPICGDSAGHAPLACVDQVLLDNGEVAQARVYHYHTDAAGTAIALTDGDGKLIWRGHYQAWGILVAQEGGLGRTSQPLRFAGQYADEETALHYNGLRVYDPDAGRYLSPDRSGPGGTSPYQYAPNPLTVCNPLGRAVPVRPAHRGAGVTVSGLDGLLDSSQRPARVVEQLDDVTGWDLV